MTPNFSPPPVRGEERGQQRSQLAGTMLSLLGWAVVVVPMILLSVLIFAAVMSPESGLAAPGRVALSVLGAGLLFAMIAAPHLLGQAVIHRERAMWRAALITGIPTLCVVLYFVFRWLGNLG